MQEAQMLRDNIEKKIRELMRTFSKMNETLLPSIENENGEIKPLQLWKEEAERVINTQVDVICDDLGNAMLEDNMDKTIHTRSFFETFERKMNQIAIKYIPYRKKNNDEMRNMLSGVISI